MSQYFQKAAAGGGCIVYTSQYEGLPLTLLEAQACGCPAIGPDVQGVNECVDPLSGGVLYPFDIAPADLAHIVLQTLQDKPQWQARSAACVRLVREKFSLERMARDYVEIYKRSPYPPLRNRAGLKARFRLAPWHWSRYLINRWSLGNEMYELATIQSSRHNWKTASILARAALVTCPTLYLRPKRMAELLRSHARAIASH